MSPLWHRYGGNGVTLSCLMGGQLKMPLTQPFAAVVGLSAFFRFAAALGHCAGCSGRSAQFFGNLVSFLGIEV